MILTKIYILDGLYYYMLFHLHICTSKLVNYLLDHEADPNKHKDINMNYCFTCQVKFVVLIKFHMNRFL